MTFRRALLTSIATNVATLALFIVGLNQRNYLFIVLVFGSLALRYWLFWRTRCDVCGKSVFDTKSLPLSMNPGYPELRCSRCGADFLRARDALP
ncbi:hypothetical protein [Phenylobacterium sp.]|uniref:hypothetical protein n=1 Tax=Phenylobacterium sp. TaxID=1871053 RepID=UPI0035B39870